MLEPMNGQTQLRPSTSSRPELIVDIRARSLADANVPPPVNRIGREGRLGRGRCVFALPRGPFELVQRTAIGDGAGHLLADPEGNLIGVAHVSVHRLLTARSVEETRRIFGPY